MWKTILLFKSYIRILNLLAKLYYYSVMYKMKLEIVEL